MGILGRILDAATPIREQLVYVDSERVALVDFDVPVDVPFGFVAIPQYAVERVLRDELAARGVRVEATVLPLVRDAAGEFARAYRCVGRGTFVVRPDGYLGYAAALSARLRSTFAR